ncbi:MAG: phage capsid protein, partial [Bryobacteraceae bacterium]
AWSQSAICLAIGKDVSARISERDDKSYATQVYASMSLGATRMRSNGIVDILCAE